MELYTTKQICKKITWLTGRMIIGMVTNKLVAPYKDADGPGDHRLYNKAGILGLIVAGSVRGMFSKGTMTALMYLLKKKHKEADYIILTPSNRTSNRAVADVTFTKGTGELDSILPSEVTGIDGELIKGDGFATVVINLKAIVKFIETNF